MLLRLRTVQLARLVPMTLAVIGSLALTFGVFVAVLTMTRTPANHPGINLPLQGAIYVGDDTCYTCHADRDEDWSQMLFSQPVASPVANPQASVIDVNVHEGVPQVGIDSGESAEVKDDDAQFADSPDRQHYVIATENVSAHSPGTVAPKLEQRDAPDGANKCAACHTIKPTVAAVRLRRGNSL